MVTTNDFIAKSSWDSKFAKSDVTIKKRFHWIMENLIQLHCLEMPFDPIFIILMVSFMLFVPNNTSIRNLIGW